MVQLYHNIIINIFFLSWHKICFTRAKKDITNSKNLLRARISADTTHGKNIIGEEKKRGNVKRKERGMMHLGKKSAQRTSSSAGTLGDRDVLSFGRERETGIRVFWTKTSHSWTLFPALHGVYHSLCITYSASVSHNFAGRRSRWSHALKTAFRNRIRRKMYPPGSGSSLGMQIRI